MDSHKQVQVKVQVQVQVQVHKQVQVHDEKERKIMTVKMDALTCVRRHKYIKVYKHYTSA